MKDMTGWTAHEDSFISDRYPGAHRPWLDEAWFLGHGIDRRPFNAAHALVDGHAAGANANALAILSPQETWSYRDLALRVNKCADLIAGDLGMRPGSAVILQCTNSPWHVAFLLGLWRAGCVAVMCGPILSVEEVSLIRSRTSAKAWITDLPGRGHERAGALQLSDLIQRVTTREIPDSNDAWVRTAPTDPALILFTSGTTGTPKATLHFQRDLIVAPLTYGQHITVLRPGDLVAGSASLSFAYGLETLLLMPLWAGAASVMRSDMAAAQMLAALQRWPVTHLFTTPSFIAALLELGVESDLGALRTCVSAGENLTADLMARWRNATHTPIVSGLGLSELNAFVLGSAPGTTPEGSLGRPVEGFEVRIIDDAQADAGSGVIGRLAVRGPTGCRYLDTPEEQAARVLDGWTLTGDLCECDDDGVFWYRGRCDDLIVRGGINIAPLEVELVLLRSPLVKECVVTGRFDETFQTRMIYAYIVLKDPLPAEAGQRELRQWAAKQLAPHKLPDVFIPVSQLPRNRNGKLDRLSLKEQGYDVAACDRASPYQEQT